MILSTINFQSIPLYNINLRIQFLSNLCSTLPLADYRDLHLLIIYKFLGAFHI